MRPRNVLVFFGNVEAVEDGFGHKERCVVADGHGDCIGRPRGEAHRPLADEDHDAAKEALALHRVDLRPDDASAELSNRRVEEVVGEGTVELFLGEAKLDRHAFGAADEQRQDAARRRIRENDDGFVFARSLHPDDHECVASGRLAQGLAEADRGFVRWAGIRAVCHALHGREQRRVALGIERARGLSTAATEEHEPG